MRRIRAGILSHGAAFIALGILALSSHAQVRTDGSVGRAATLAGPNFQVTQDLGRVVGANLFHSFHTFNVGYGEVATFLASPGIANIISRVTGGNVSQVNGTLRVSAGAGRPALWLMNPAGVVFGPGAALDVPGAFHVTTAAYVKFADGEWHADPSRTSTFSSLAPEAFGFLGDSRASIRIEDNPALRSRGSIDVTAGDVAISHAHLSSASDIRLVAVGSGASEVAVSGPALNAAGRTELTNGGLVSTHAGQAGLGNIGIYTGSLHLDAGRSSERTGVVAESDGMRPGGSIRVHATGNVDILNGAVIETQGNGPGNAGDIRVSARSMTLDGHGVEDTGIVSFASTDGAGASGSVEVSVEGRLHIANGGIIGSDTTGAGSAGAVRVAAGSIFMDGQNSGVFTGISSDARTGSQGDGGSVEVTTEGEIRMLAGSEISSTTYAAGNAGNVRVAAGSLLIDGSRALEYTTGIHSSAYEESTGNAGNVDVVVRGEARVVGTGEISADTYSRGRAGNVTVAAQVLILDGLYLDYYTGISSDAFEGSGSGGNVQVNADRLVVTGGALISADTYTAGNAGNVTVVARDLLVDGGGVPTYTGISSDAVEGTGNAGNVEVRADSLVIRGGGQISSDTFTSGAAGAVTVRAGSLMVTGHDTNGGGGSSISSAAAEGSGSGGRVRVVVDGLLSITEGGNISSGTFTSGNAGEVEVSAGSLFLDGRDADGSSYRFLTGISSQANPDATGNAGRLTLNVTGDATLIGSSSVSTSTFHTGIAGDIVVRVGGNLTMVGLPPFPTGIFSNSYSVDGGLAGNVDLQVQGALVLRSGGVIESDTESRSPAGRVNVAAGSLLIEGGPIFTGISTDARSQSGGDAGDVVVEVARDALITHGGAIASLTRGAGNAGTVTFRANSLRIEGASGERRSEISTSSLGTASGNAGSVEVVIDGALEILNGGAVTSATSSATGRAGSLDIRASRVLIDGRDSGRASEVSARSAQGASGHTGDISIVASGSVSVTNGGRISAANDSTTAASVAQGSRIRISAPSVNVLSGGSITSQSTGNVAASDISIEAPGTLLIDSGSITTSANLGDGGGISVDAGRIVMRDAQITTSVVGSVGNGGDISIVADLLQMETGFVQANTAAASASGGNVLIDVGLIAASGGTVFVGGSTPIAFSPGVFALNVIQAAAPTGVSGAIDITSPVLDTSGALAGLGASPLDTSGLGRNPCRVGAGSSLALVGRGGLPPSARDAFRPDPIEVARNADAITPWRLASSRAPCGRRASL